jgi:Co/Zn/Cd efflux system component
VEHARFHIAKMDCPSEENLIRLKLQDFKGTIHFLDFDLEQRELAIWYEGEFPRLQSLIADLELSDRVLSRDWQKPPELKENPRRERRLLIYVLLINFSFFFIELFTGLYSTSFGLQADGLDMLADALVYGLALMALNRSVSLQKRVALAAGILQISLAGLGLYSLGIRFTAADYTPLSSVMIATSFLALLANSWCLYLLHSHRSKKASWQASTIFTSNDVIINAGVITAGVLVWYFQSPWPDLLIGLTIFLIVAYGAFRIFKLSKT